MNKKQFRLKAVSLALLAASGSIWLLNGCSSVPTQTVAAEQSAAQSIITSPNDNRQYQTITLPNQLQVVLVSDPSAEKSAAALNVDVGWLNDPKEQQGLAHFLEHMLFMGTERFPDPDGFINFMSQHGGTYNAFTNQLTNYMFEINNSHFDEALDRFSDFFKSPLLLPDYIEKERHAVHSEWSMMRTMDGWAMLALGAKLLGDHPANQFWVGNLETLSDKEGSKLHDELLAFYQNYYSANRMQLVLISPQPLPEMQLLAQRFFADIENKDLASPRPTRCINFEQLGPRLVHFVPNTEMQLVRLGFTIKNNLDHFASKPNEFLAHLIRSEMPGTPAQQLKAMGLVDAVHVDYDPKFYGNYGHFNINIALTAAGMQQRDAITAIFMQYLELIRQQGVDERYYQEIRTSLQNQFNFLEKRDGFGYAAQLSSAMQYYPVASVVSAPFQYDGFDAEAIDALLAQLVPDRLTVWHISQQEPAEHELTFFEGRYSVQPIGEEQLQAWQQPLLPLSLPALNRFQPESFAVQHSDYSQPTQVLNEGGVEAWLMGSAHFSDQPRGHLLMQWHQPTAKSTAQEAVMHDLWQLIFMVNNQALLQEASAAGMQLQPEGEEFDLVWRLAGFTDKQPELVQEIGRLLASEVSAQQFAQGMDLLQRQLRSFEQQLQVRQAGEWMRTTMLSGRFELSAMLEASNQVSLEQLNAYIQQTLAASQLRVLAQGNYSTTDVIAMAQALRGSQQTERAYQISPRWQPKAEERLLVLRSNPQDDSSLVRTQMLPNAGVAGQAAAKVLSGHLHQAFFNQLRTEEGLGYVVQAGELPFNDHAGVAFYIQSPVLSAEQLQQRVERFMQEYGDQVAALTDDEFSRLKEAQLLELRRAPNNLTEEFASMRMDWLRNRLGFDSKARLTAAVEALTLLELQHFYQQVALSDQAAALQVILQGQAQEQDFTPLPRFKVLEDLADFHQGF
ncbi:insulinase family protein [Alkalimonas sp.]|uniref:insulinase family protein n=1 Tax=Alkalimonas sp. TaxID=1872453 RepID=UPI00263A6BCA|nr:insulinase family protein [Alkalimonas sp.]MCC5827407.1 insulinase family protein [Alkalimonas sp.]